MPPRVIIPKDVLQDAVDKAYNLIRRDIEAQLRMQFEETKAEMIQEFMNHPVTEEIMNGANAENISGTLGGRDGNLFSFIGFEASDDPITPIIEILEGTSVSFAYFKRIGMRMTIKIPSPETIFKATPMPWADGRSWTKGIESGISGLGFYIQKYNQGRSEGGIQTTGKVSAGRFKNTAYISSILNKYTEKFSSLTLATTKIKKI